MGMWRDMGGWRILCAIGGRALGVFGLRPGACFSSKFETTADFKQPYSRNRGKLSTLMEPMPGLSTTRSLPCLKEAILKVYEWKRDGVPPKVHKRRDSVGLLSPLSAQSSKSESQGARWHGLPDADPSQWCFSHGVLTAMANSNFSMNLNATICM